MGVRRECGSQGEGDPKMLRILHPNKDTGQLATTRKVYEQNCPAIMDRCGQSLGRKEVLLFTP